MRALPQTSREPNQGIKPPQMVFSHRDASANSTATGFRSTPYTFRPAMYIFTCWSRLNRSPWGISSPSSRCFLSR